MFFYLEAELLFTERIGSLMGEATGTVYYGFFCIAAAAGFLAYALLSRITKERRDMLIRALGCAGAACTLLAGLVGSLAAFVTLFAMLMAGFAGASLLYSMSAIEEKSALGMFIALPYATAFLLQYICDQLMPLFGNSGTLMEYIAITAALIASLMLTPKKYSAPK